MRTLCPLVLCLASTVKAAVAGDHGTASVQRPLQLSQQHSLPAEADPKIVLGLDPMRELRNALHVMQDTWFALYAGTWPSGIDWTRAVLDTHLIASAASLSRLIDQPHSNHSQRRELENEMNKYFTQNVGVFTSFHHTTISTAKTRSMCIRAAKPFTAASYISIHQTHWRVM